MSVEPMSLTRISMWSSLIRARACAGDSAIAVTAYARTEDRTRALPAGYQAHLAKPIEAAELVATIASLADLIEARRRARQADMSAIRDVPTRPFGRSAPTIDNRPHGQPSSTRIPAHNRSSILRRTIGSMFMRVNSKCAYQLRPPSNAEVR